MIIKIRPAKTVLRAFGVEIEKRQNRRGYYLLWKFTTKQGTVVGYTPYPCTTGDLGYNWFYKLLNSEEVKPFRLIDTEVLKNRNMFLVINAKGVVTDVIPID
ncbi:MAG: hypothetical protein ACTSYR_02045 [Candidatus Odinarchaeia archaeon]